MVKKDWAIDDVIATRGFLDEDEFMEWYLDTFMGEVYEKLMTEYGIFADTCSQGGGRIGKDFLSFKDDDEVNVAEWDLEEERKCMEEVIDSSDSFDEAINKAVEEMKNYAYENGQFDVNYTYDDEWFDDEDEDDEFDDEFDEE